MPFREPMAAGLLSVTCCCWPGVSPCHQLLTCAGAVSLAGTESCTAVALVKTGAWGAAVWAEAAATGRAMIVAEPSVPAAKTFTPATPGPVARSAIVFDGLVCRPQYRASDGSFLRLLMSRPFPSLLA